MATSLHDISGATTQSHAPHQPDQNHRKMSNAAHQAVELHIELIGTAPAIWRRLRVPIKADFSQLHDILQCAFDWDDSHLHAFYVGKQEYQHPDQMYGDAGDQRSKDERRLTLSALIEADTGEFTYVYDFGDDWRHRIRLERVVTVADPKELLALLDGDNAAPPEDSGGPPGYYYILEALADPESKEYEETVDWIGEEFDPTVLDNAAIGARLENLRRYFASSWTG